MMTPYTPPKSDPIDVVYRDKALIIVNKPSGLLSVPGRGPEKADCMISRVNADFPTARIVHRLDMETSGLLILALNDEVQRAISMLFERRAVEKTYIAMVAGRPETDEGQVDLPLSKDWPNRPMQKVDIKGGKPSQTLWKVLERLGGRSRLELKPVTGRTHQLRVHMNELGYPILGDGLYGSCGSKSGAPKLLLHASSLRFVHPVTGEALMVQSQPDF